jgi:hypothetical protein
MHHSMHYDYSEIEQGFLATRLPFPMAGFSAAPRNPNVDRHCLERKMIKRTNWNELDACLSILFNL